MAKRKLWAETDMKLAMDAINSNEMSAREAAKEFSVPPRVLLWVPHHSLKVAYM